MLQIKDEMYQCLINLMSDIQWRLNPEGDNDDDWIFNEDSWKQCERIVEIYEKGKRQ